MGTISVQGPVPYRALIAQVKRKFMESAVVNNLSLEFIRSLA